jgi:hypothetical protein
LRDQVVPWTVNLASNKVRFPVPRELMALAERLLHFDSAGGAAGGIVGVLDPLQDRTTGSSRERAVSASRAGASTAVGWAAADPFRLRRDAP